MLRKINLVFLVAMFALATNSMAITHNLRPNMGMEYPITLAPNKPETLINPTMFTIQAKCTLKTERPGLSNTIRIRGVFRTSEINGQVIKAKEEITISVNDGSTISIKAPPAASVQLTNLSSHSIKALCGT